MFYHLSHGVVVNRYFSMDKDLLLMGSTIRAASPRSINYTTHTWFWSPQLIFCLGPPVTAQAPHEERSGRTCRPNWIKTSIFFRA